MELPKQLLYLRAQLGFMEAREANHAEKTNIHNIQAIRLEILFPMLQLVTMTYFRS